MSDEIPTATSRRTPKAHAAEAPAVADTPAPAVPVDGAPVEPVAEPVVERTATGEDAPAPATATGEVAPVAATGEVAPVASGVAGQQVVYVQAPLPPKVRGNRVIGVLLALLGTVVFAAVYAGAASIPLALRFSGGDGFSPAFSAFVQNAIFWIPIMMFALAFVVLTVVLNRAGWWAHVLGSLLVAVFVYFASIGLLLLVGNVFALTPRQASSAFGDLATNPLMIAAALVAREVSIWIGLAIAARGRRVKARNVETRTAWDREQDEKKAEYERAAAPA
jgi:hypothetical protein